MSKEKTSYAGYFIISLMLLAAGVLLIVFGDALKIMSISIGAVLAVYAVFLAITAIARTVKDFNFAIKITLAVICLAAGIVTMIFNEGAAKIIISLISLLLIIDSSFKLNTCAMAKRYSVGAWWILAIPAALIIAGAFYLLEFVPPDITLKSHSMILGIFVIADSLINFASAFFVKKCDKNMRDDIYYDFYKDEMSKK